MIRIGGGHRAIASAVILFGVLVVIGIWGVVIHVLDHDRDTVELSAKARAASLAQTYEQHVLRSVSEIDHALQYFRELHAHDAPAFIERMSIVKNLTFRDLALRVSILSSAGRLLYSDGDPDTQPIDLSAHESFDVHRRSETDRLFISKPVVENSHRSIQFSRRLDSADGSFGGALVLSVSPSHFTRFQGALHLGEQGGMTLVGTDQVIRARAAAGREDTAAVGEILPAERPYFSAANAEGSFWTTSAFSHDRRLVAFRRLADFPLIVSIHLTWDEVFAAHLDRRRYYLSTAGVASLGVFAFIAVVAWLIVIQGQARFNLAVARQQLRTMLDNIPHMAWLKDREGRFVAVNQAFAASAGRPENQIVGQTDFDVWPDELAHKHRDDDEQVIATGLRKDMEEERFVGGRPRWFETFKTPVYDSNGHCVGIAGLARDISDRVEAQEALQAALETTGSILNALDSAVYVADMTTHEVLFANRVLRARFGVIKGKACWQSVHTGQIGPCAFCNNDQLVDERGNPTGVHGREYFSHLTGRWYECRDVAIPWGDRGLVRLEIATDLTQRKHMEDELKRSNADLEQFSYAISHDLQAPLRMVSSYLQLLVRRHGEQLDEESREFIGYAVDGAARMNRMIQGLLEFSRINRKGEEFATFAMERALDEALENLRTDIETKRARIHREPLPMVRGDVTQIMRVFQNLIGNALKYQAPGVTPDVEITAAPEGEQWVVRIRDNGIGIEPSQAGRLFKVFQRLHGPGEFEGTGIGLAVVRRIVERHGGRVWVESDGPGHGSTFAFSLPRLD